MKSRHFGRTLPIPSTLQIVHDLLVFSAAEQSKRDKLPVPSHASEPVVGAAEVTRP